MLVSKPYWLIGLILINTSCSNKIDVLGPYEEQAAVYAIIDPNQPVQYFKINKVFTNPNRAATTVAQIPDSLYFDSIAPYLVEIETGSVLPLYKTVLPNKGAGVFAAGPNYMYATTEKLKYNSKTRLMHYRMELLLPHSKKLITATTNITDSIKLDEPTSLIDPLKPSVEMIPDSNLRFEFLEPVNGKIIDAWFYFNYREMNKYDSTIFKDKVLQWKLIDQLPTFAESNGVKVDVFVKTNLFYDLVLSNIPVDTTVNRRVLPCRMEFVVGNLELNNYIQSSMPSIGIVQKSGTYSNIVNGLGIFASRAISRHEHIAFAADYLIYWSRFKKLRFRR